VITLRQLRYLEALARVRHFGRAAEQCAITQPALSMQIRDLERELDLSLFERGKGKITLTREGQEIIERARHVLNGVHDIYDYARHRGQGLEGPLSLGVIPSIAPYLLPCFLPALGSSYPDLELHIRETQTDTLVAELLSGSLDVLLLALPIELDEIEMMPVFEDHFLLAAPSKQGFSPEERVTHEFVMKQELLLLEEGHCLRDQALEYCNMVRPELLHSFGATSLTTLLQLVANGHGVTLLPEMCLVSEGHDPRVSLLRFEEPEPRRTVGLAWRSACPRGNAFRALGALIEKAKSSMPLTDAMSG